MPPGWDPLQARLDRYGLDEADARRVGEAADRLRVEDHRVANSFVAARECSLICVVSQGTSSTPSGTGSPLP
jgi:prolyl-tRNA editing enzyme YbaK/EbsC (Cys-tRNA(Pro) deacylase)